jgi:hypothetical protein
MVHVNPSATQLTIPYCDRHDSQCGGAGDLLALAQPRTWRDNAQQSEQAFRGLLLQETGSTMPGDGFGSIAEAQSSSARRAFCRNALPLNNAREALEWSRSLEVENCSQGKRF